MAAAPFDETSPDAPREDPGGLAAPDDSGPPRGEPAVEDLSLAIKHVPPSRELRERIRELADRAATGLDPRDPLDKTAIAAHARAILAELHQPEAFLGWTMVALASAFWRDRVAATPYARRLLLLPHCLRNPDHCPARFNELGLVCQDCGACRLSSLRQHAERLGYKVLIAEGSPVVMQLILGGHADALVGVSCLDVLEKSLEKILLAGVPCMAVPLVVDGCRNTRTDEDWVRDMIDTPYRPIERQTHTFVHLLRCAKRLFQPEEIEWLLPRGRGGPTLAQTNGAGLAAIDPVAATEAIARDFLLRGGKRARPFVTLAAFDALSGADATGADGARHVARIDEVVKRVAVAIEIFHKASLVHDDIEDDDAFRYGHVTLHRKYGTAMAINVGDYLIGLGYRVVAQQRGRLAADVVADILAQLAEAHTRLSEGQGAELAWRDALDKRLAPLDALRIYALKTAPAFEAALFAGLRLAGPVHEGRDLVARFARHLGVAFQILNDLDDWRSDSPNKRTAGTDVLGGRPTVLWALALDALDETDRRELEALPARSTARDAAVARADELYRRAGVHDRAAALVEKHHARARDVADQIHPAPLRHLLHYLADSILDR
ncbi:MAG: polyprenyl synthetase family protein [Pirellulales bacterium]|nr:polyprenyl synthetase family protein [Pirellulales bacterium]